MYVVVVGTRPEIIKMSPIIKEFELKKIDYYLLHTGQHYSYEMDKVFFENLELSPPSCNLQVGSGTQSSQTGAIMIGVEKHLMRLNIESNTIPVILVQGDTNTVLGAALAAIKLKFPVMHVEAGLRCFDRSMPEEINRVITDHKSDILFVPTEIGLKNLLSEGIDRKKTHLTGNTIVDVIYSNLPKAKKRLKPFRGDYFLATIHRQENVDHINQLKKIMFALTTLNNIYSMPIIFPIHPRTKKMIEFYNIPTGGISVIEPQGFLDFIKLESEARLILTDSGGVQEEACILKVPCVTLRNATERQETEQIGANLVTGAEPVRIVNGVKKMLQISREWTCPYGDGTAGKSIVNILEGIGS